MDIWKKSVILGVTLLAFCVLVETMGLCKFARMFPHKERKQLIKNETLQEDKGVDCPSGYNKKLNDSCYKFAGSGSGTTRSEAISACKGDSSHLVFIETKQENDFLIREAENNIEYWIGVHERPNLFWDSGNQVTFANIDPDNDATFDDATGCFVMSDNDGRYWTDRRCSARYGFICEYEGTVCPSGYNKTFYNSCYKFADSVPGATRSAARSTCIKDSSHLVFIETKEENNFLVGEAANGTLYWIGIHHRPHLFWDSGYQVTFTSFNPDEKWTFNDGKSCYRLEGNGNKFWYDAGSSAELGYICECEGAGCPPGYSKEFHNSYYMFADSRATRFAARSACERDSSHLVFIETKEENDFLVETLKKTGYWIGIHGRPNLFWDNGNDVTFTNIDPDNWCTFIHDTGCYRMAGDNERRWLDSSCREEHGFICEYEAGTDCPPGYTKRFSASCYKFVDSLPGATRSEARSACEGNSSHLVFIETKEENDFLVREAGSNSEYWIGTHKRPNLFWNNGNPVTFANINPDGEATFNDRTGCYKMSNNVGKYWFDDDCQHKNGFICEYEG